jgi:hypothetical protein
MVESSEIKINVDEMSANYKETALDIIRNLNKTAKRGVKTEEI